MGLAIGMLMTCAGGPGLLSFEYLLACTGSLLYILLLVLCVSANVWKIEVARKIKAAEEIANKSRRFTERSQACITFSQKNTWPPRLLWLPNHYRLLFRMIDAIVMDDISNASSNADRKKRAPTINVLSRKLTAYTLYSVASICACVKFV